MELYNFWREVPKEAITPISGGKLKGFSDINPMWRMEMLTQRFGACGTGWKYEVVRREIINGSGNQLVAFVGINLYYKTESGWSEPIYGEGGSFFVQGTKNGLETNDDAYKMALTDAISIAGKALGIGANVWFKNSLTKYTKPQPTTEATGTGKSNGTKSKPAQDPPAAQPEPQPSAQPETPPADISYRDYCLQYNTVEDLKAFWDANVALQSVPEFANEVTKRKSELSQK